MDGKATAGGQRTALTQLREHLEEEQRRVRQEIAAYPRPITGCDAQFNTCWPSATARGAEVEEVILVLDAAGDAD